MGLTVSVAAQGVQPVGGALSSGPVHIGQNQRPDREALLVGEQSRVVGPGGQGEDEGKSLEV